MQYTLLYFGTRVYLFSPEEGSRYLFSTRNNCCEFLASDGVIFSLNHSSKRQFFGAPFTSCAVESKFHFSKSDTHNNGFWKIDNSNVTIECNFHFRRETMCQRNVRRPDCLFFLKVTSWKKTYLKLLFHTIIRKHEKNQNFVQF